MAVRLIDIAIACGVSRGTVDRALHHRGGVAPEVEAKINETAVKMGFVPNRAGRLLATQKRKIRIGCLLPDVGNPFFIDVIRGIADAGSSLADFNVEVTVRHVKGYEPEAHLRALESLAGEDYDGYCLTTITDSRVTALVGRLFKDKPIVSVNVNSASVHPICYVGPDYYRDGMTSGGLCALMGKEPRKILFVIGSPMVSGHLERVKGFKASLEKQGVPFEEVATLTSNDDDAMAYRRTLACLKNHPETNLVFIAGAGVEGVCRAVYESGLRPHVAAFDDIPATRAYIKAGLIDFTISQDPFVQGREAVERLFDYIAADGKRQLDDYIINSRIKIAQNIDQE